MAGETEQIVQDVKAAVDEIRKVVDTKGIDSPEFKALEERVADVLKKDEQAHDKYTKEKAEADKKAFELEERLKDMELEIVKSAPAAGLNYKELPNYKALNKWCKTGDKGLDVEEFKTMRMDDGTAGGYLTTTEMDTAIIKTITEISPVRSVARVKTISSKTLEIPKRTAIPTANYEGEAEQNQEDQSVYGNEQLTAYRLSVTIPFTMDLLGDSQFDLESEINGDAAEAFAFKEGNKFVLGTGVKQPEGFVINAAVATNKRTSEAAGTISGDDLLLLTGDLKVGYNPMYGFNRQTLAFLRTLKITNGPYLWQQSLATEAPNTIAGEPYVIFQDMASIASLSYSVIYGDFLRGYCITDRTGMVIVRDEVTSARNAIIKLTFHRWNTGQVVLSEAFKLLQTKTT